MKNRADTNGHNTGPLQPGLDAATEGVSLHVALVAYAKAASAREKLERRLSMGATAASAIVALSIFASLSASPSATAKLLTGILSAIAAALASLDKLSAKAPSSALLARAGELATL